MRYHRHARRRRIVSSSCTEGESQMIIQFPDAAERDRLLIVRNIAAALREYLTDEPKSASACRKFANKAGGDRKDYEAARRQLDLWCIRP
jgi:hypothetical protein